MTHSIAKHSVNQSDLSFTSDFPILASIALAFGGQTTPPEAHPVTSRLQFSFASSSLPVDFERKVMDGEITVNAKELLVAHNVIIGLVQRHQRTRRNQGGSR